MPIISCFPGGGGNNSVLTLDPVSNIEVESDGIQVNVKWTDPSDVVANGVTLAAWGGTILVRKEGSVPKSAQDGTVVLLSTERGAYSDSYFCDSGAGPVGTYYYKFFPYTTNGAYTDDPADEFKAQIDHTLDNCTWAQIHKYSSDGANYWAVGDCKGITLNGTVGTLTLSSETLYVYILGFNHNQTYEGEGIHFGGFKTGATDGVDVCLIDSKYDHPSSNGTKCFNLNHWGSSSSQYNTNYGGWAGCDTRYDILGSTDTAPSGYGSTPTTDRVGYDASTTCATSPVSGTLMAALPSDLRAVMQPMTKYTDNVGNKSNTAAGVSATVDYLPLLAEFEIFGARSYANAYEENYQKQYDYFSAGNSKVRYCHSATATSAYWWERSPSYSSTFYFCDVGTSGSATTGNNLSRCSYGLCPAFKV
jgi:hypothetical protein